MPDRPSPPGMSIGRLLLAPVAFAAVFVPVAWSRESRPVPWGHVPEGLGTFWASIAPVALAEATRRSRSGREATAALVGFGVGTAVGWPLHDTDTGFGLLIGPFIGWVAFRIARLRRVGRDRGDGPRQIRITEETIPR